MAWGIALRSDEMERPPSLRNRLLLGAVLWTIGLLIFIGAALVTAIELHPHVRLAFIVHDIFRQPLVMGFGVFSMVAGLVQVRRGLSPINNLRTRLAGLHEGRDRRVEGTYPTEVQPLVNDLNALLDHREQAVRRAVAKAGDLAHGLKTPLAILAQEARTREGRRSNRGGRRRHAAGRSHAEAGGLSPRPGACRGIGRGARSAMLDQGIG